MTFDYREPLGIVLIGFAIVCIGFILYSLNTTNPATLSVIGALAGTVLYCGTNLITTERKKLRITKPILKFALQGVSKTAKFNPIQFLNMAWGSYTIENGQTKGQKYELHVLFGVIEVKCSKMDALGCRAEIEYQVEMPSKETLWLNGGYLNWFSTSKRNNLATTKDFDLNKFNSYLVNTTEDVHKDETRYLQLCYVTDGYNALRLCTDVIWPSPVPISTNETARLRTRITITAANFDKKVMNVEITATRNQIDLVES